MGLRRLVIAGCLVLAGAAGVGGWFAAGDPAARAGDGPGREPVTAATVPSTTVETSWPMSASTAMSGQGGLAGVRAAMDANPALARKLRQAVLDHRLAKAAETDPELRERLARMANPPPPPASLKPPQTVRTPDGGERALPRARMNVPPPAVQPWGGLVRPAPQPKPPPVTPDGAS